MAGVLLLFCSRHERPVAKPEPANDLPRRQRLSGAPQLQVVVVKGARGCQGAVLRVPCGAVRQLALCVKGALQRERIACHPHHVKAGMHAWNRKRARVSLPSGPSKQAGNKAQTRPSRDGRTGTQQQLGIVRVPL